MSRLVVCGDSFMTPVTTHPKTHFSEIIADNLGYELVAYRVSEGNRLKIWFKTR